jgi:hypothetical protein
VMLGRILDYWRQSRPQGNQELDQTLNIIASRLHAPTIVTATLPTAQRGGDATREPSEVITGTGASTWLGQYLSSSVAASS